MKEPPAGIEERDIAAALASHWGLAGVEAQYLAVGFGDHHWMATEAGGRRWFVTVAEGSRIQATSCARAAVCCWSTGTPWA